MIRMTSRLNFERMYSIDIGQIQYEKIIIILFVFVILGIHKKVRRLVPFSASAYSSARGNCGRPLASHAGPDLAIFSCFLCLMRAWRFLLACSLLYVGKKSKGGPWCFARFDLYFDPECDVDASPLACICFSFLHFSLANSYIEQDRYTVV